MTQGGHIEYEIGISLCSAIPAGNYEIGKAKITVSYPREIDLGYKFPVELPFGHCTLCRVAWAEKNQRTKAPVGAEKVKLVRKALADINQLFSTWQLAHVGHLAFMTLRTVGLADTLFYRVYVDGEMSPDKSTRIPLDFNESPNARLKIADPWQRFGTFELPEGYMDGTSFAVARRYIKCFELFEHGYSSEVVVIAHSILDDVVQQMIKSLLASRGLDEGFSNNTYSWCDKEPAQHVFRSHLEKLKRETIERSLAGSRCRAGMAQ